MSRVDGERSVRRITCACDPHGVLNPGTMSD